MQQEIRTGRNRLEDRSKSGERPTWRWSLKSLTRGRRIGVRPGFAPGTLRELMLALEQG
jgi:hypothetical protein